MPLELSPKWDREIFPLPLDVITLYYSGYGLDTTWSASGDTSWYTDTDYGVEYR